MQNREKQIEEMAKVIQNTYLPINQGNVTVGETRLYSRDAHRLAENLYNAGYRKATEVAEEIFAEIEKLLRENQFTLIPPYRSEITDWKTVFRLKLAGDIAELKKKYTEGNNNEV